MIKAKKMQGLSMIGWLLVIFIVAFFASTAIKVIPVYMDHYSMRSIVNKAIKSGELTGMKKNKVKGFFNSRFNMNSLYDIKADYFEIDRAANGALTINGNYEKRIPYFYNIDLVFKFDDMVFDVPAP